MKPQQSVGLLKEALRTREEQWNMTLDMFRKIGISGQYDMARGTQSDRYHAIVSAAFEITFKENLTVRERC